MTDNAGLGEPENYQLAFLVVEVLSQAGKEAYFAGGFPRDRLLGCPSKDVDIAANASPEEVRTILAVRDVDSQLVGAAQAYPVVLACQGGVQVEIASFRHDVYELQHIEEFSRDRRPQEIRPGSIWEDASRRDFTINALYYNPLTKATLDPTGQGIADGRSRILRFIGDPNRRIGEDNLRILRAVRLKNQLGLTYEDNTWSALKQNRGKILAIKPERLGGELTKILLLPSRVESLKDLDQLGILELLLPEVAAGKGIAQPFEYHQEGDVFTHQLLALAKLPVKVTPSLVWATLLHDIGKPGRQGRSKEGGISFHGHDRLGAELAGRLLRERFGFSKKLIEKVVWLITNHMYLHGLPKLSRAKQLRLVTNPYFSEALALLEADRAASYTKEPEDKTLKEIRQLIQQFEEEKIQHLPNIKKDLGISGHTLIESLQIREEQKPALKSLIAYLDGLLQDCSVTTKEEVIKKAEEWWKKHLPLR